jgi:hypothetical protein
MEYKMNNKKQILYMLAFFCIGVGLWENFRQLWLQSNNFNVSQISTTLSIASLVSAICIFISSTKIQLSKIKEFISITLLLKIFVMFLLFLNSNGNMQIIRLLIILDIVLEKFVILSIYPLMICVEKSDTLYSKRKLIEYLCRDIGMFVGGITIGKTISNLIINYNILLFLSLIFTIISALILININVKNENKKTNVSFKYIIKDKITIIYLLYYFIASIAMSVGLGLKMLMLTTKLGFSDVSATNYLLIIGLIADIIGIIALKFLTFKNDYLTITIKFGIRLLIYLLAFFTNKYIIIIISITWSILISTAYENKTDAPYINRIKNEYHIFFSNIRYMIWMTGNSIGLYFAGIMYQYGINYMFGLSSIFMLFQLGLAYYLISLRNKEEILK